MSAFPVAQALLAIIAIWIATPVASATESRLDDADITMAVRVLLSQGAIQVEVDHGIATLTGTVQSPYAAEVAQHLAFRAGARLVSDRLEIEPDRQDTTDDRSEP